MHNLQKNNAQKLLVSSTPVSLPLNQTAAIPILKWDDTRFMRVLGPVNLISTATTSEPATVASTTDYSG